MPNKEMPQKNSQSKTGTGTNKSDVPPKFSEDTHKRAQSSGWNKELEEETDFERTGRESLVEDKSGKKGGKTSTH